MWDFRDPGYLQGPQRGRRPVILAPGHADSSCPMQGQVQGQWKQKGFVCSDCSSVDTGVKNVEVLGFLTLILKESMLATCLAQSPEGKSNFRSFSL